ncbi:MAG: hypothetical protein EOO24_39640 [Comamonadaceae bacterium]|nr:MAG: hypothetical protein EOO24_39640 [Comamonadaceae bacterium]
MNLKKMTCQALVASMLTLSFQAANAGLIQPEQAAAGTVQADRTQVLEVLARADVAAQVAAQGVDPLQARERIQAMSDQEVSQLAQDIRTAPAGADAGGVLLAVVIVSAVWYFFFRR